MKPFRKVFFFISSPLLYLGHTYMYRSLDVLSADPLFYPLFNTNSPIAFKVLNPVLTLFSDKEVI